MNYELKVLILTLSISDIIYGSNCAQKYNFYKDILILP